MDTVDSPYPVGIRALGGADRHELKYAVAESTAIEVIQWTSAFLQRDRGIPGAQRITSLYLDTPSLAFYQWHEERRKERFKLRVRTYGDGGQAAWLEIKRKTAGVVRKERQEVPMAILDSLLRSTESSNQTCNAFLTERVKRQATPRMLLRCSRDAFREKTAAGEIAVTVDRDIVCQPTSRYDMVAPSNWRPVQLPALADAAMAIVEVKFQQQPPVWMATLMESLAAMKVSFSKYHAAVKQNMCTTSSAR
jgi:hypothetical protein